MGITAFLLALLAPVGGYLAKNGVSLAVKFSPLVIFASIFGVEWVTDTVWSRFWLVALVASAVVLTLEVRGALNIFAPTPKS